MNFIDWLYIYHFITSADFDRLSKDDQELLMSEYHSYYLSLKKDESGDLRDDQEIQ